MSVQIKGLSKMNAILRQGIVVVTFLVTLVINGMASSGALGGTPTGEISNAYPIYFVPARRKNPSISAFDSLMRATLSRRLVAGRFWVMENPR